MPEEQSERNRRIVDQHKCGMTVKAIAKDHGVSASRVAQIIEATANRERWRHECIERWGTLLSARAHNSLYYAGYKTPTDVRNARLRDLRGIPNIGHKTLNEICCAFRATAPQPFDVKILPAEF